MAHSFGNVCLFIKHFNPRLHTCKCVFQTAANVILESTSQNRKEKSLFLIIQLCQKAENVLLTKLDFNHLNKLHQQCAFEFIFRFSSFLMNRIQLICLIKPEGTTCEDRMVC